MRDRAERVRGRSQVPDYCSQKRECISDERMYIYIYIYKEDGTEKH